jgi:hypothetical protein
VRSSRPALAALVAANVVPLFGVVALGWGVYDVMLIYWLENGVVGAFTLLRMATAGRNPASVLFMGPFFTVHYGMFWLVHGVFVVTLFGPAGPFGGTPDGPAASGPALPFALPIAGEIPLVAGAGWALAALVLSHGVSFVQNWLMGGERDGVDPGALMPRPYGRVVVLHLTLIAGGFFVMALGAPVLALALMVALKIGVDAAAHLRSHASARGANRAWRPA